MNPNRVRFVITAVFGVVIVVVVYALVHPLLTSSTTSNSSSSSTKPNPHPAVYVVNDSHFSAGLPTGWAVAKDFPATVKTAPGVVAKVWEFQGQSTTAEVIAIAETPSQTDLPQAAGSSNYRSTQVKIDGETAIFTATIPNPAPPLASLSVIRNGELFSVNISGFDNSADPEKVANDLIATWNWK